MTQTEARAPAPDRQPAPRLEPKASIRLTGRGAITALFALCFLSLLLAAWTGWNPLAGAMFVCACGSVTYYTKTSGLRGVVVAPPLLFFAGCVCVELITASGKFMIAEGILVTLGISAPWLFTGTALTIVVAIGRGYRPLSPLLFRLRSRLPGRWAGRWRPSDSAGRRRNLGAGGR
jgi:hypothetical protein